MTAGATVVHSAPQTSCDRRVDDQEDVTVLDVVGPELERCSALADRLARLLFPESLFS